MTSPERSVAEALVEALESVAVEGERVLVARASEARDVLPDALSGRDAQVDVVLLYDTVAEPLADELREALRRATYVTFTQLHRALLPRGGRRGPPDARDLDRAGDERDGARGRLTVHAEAARHDLDGLVDAILEDAGR